LKRPALPAANSRGSFFSLQWVLVANGQKQHPGGRQRTSRGAQQGFELHARRDHIRAQGLRSFDARAMASADGFQSENRAVLLGHLVGAAEERQLVVGSFNCGN
jgi:hypothetical protein